MICIDLWFTLIWIANPVIHRPGATLPARLGTIPQPRNRTRNILPPNRHRSWNYLKIDFFQIIFEKSFDFSKNLFQVNLVYIIETLKQIKYFKLCWGRLAQWKSIHFLILFALKDRGSKLAVLQNFFAMWQIKMHDLE